MKFEEYTISFSDMIHIVKRHKKPIIIWTVALSLLASFYILYKPNVYQATGYFKELGKSQEEAKGSLSRLILGSGNDTAGSQAISVMKSRTLLTEVVKKLGLQGKLHEAGKRPGFFRNMLDRFRVEWAHLCKCEQVDVFCPDCPLSLSSIDYEGMTTIPLTLVFTSPTSFVVKNHFGNVGEGRLGHPFRTDYFSFTLAHNRVEDFEGRQFSLTLIPLWKMLGHLDSWMEVDVDDNDATLLTLEYSDPSRSVAEQVVDETMRAYQNYLKQEHDRSADIQVSYLKTRQEEMLGHLTKVMRQHAKILARDLSSTGFVNFDKEMEFLFRNRLTCLEKINTLDLKLQRLDQLLEENQNREGQILTHEELNRINPVLEQVTVYKMQRDALTLALTETQTKSPSNLDDQIAALENVDQNLRELKLLTTAIEKGKKVDPSFSLLHNSQFQVKDWIKTLNQSSSKEPCLAYLNHLNRLFEMQRRVVQERITFQCQGHTEYQGIDLETATQLQLAYIKEAHQFESTEKEMEFILAQLEDPGFEINSLSATLKDPISQEIIQKSTALALQLRDQKYHSPKEQERTKEELETQKRFLSAHLKQTVDVKKLHNQLLQDRIRVLQGVMLELINERISVLEKHIHDFIDAQATSFKQQKELIIDYMNEINQNMATLPDKWISEQIMKQNVDLNQAIVEELTRLVESKNISHNLDLIQSAPLDAAWAGALPKKPRIILIAVIGALLGAFASSSYYILKQLFIGIEANFNNLKVLNQNIAGPYQQDPLNTLRQVASFMEKQILSAGKGRTLLAVEGLGPHYIPDLARLMSKKGQKILVIALSSHEPGLIQYFKGETPFPRVVHTQDFDLLSGGGKDRYLPEMIQSSQFAEWLLNCREKYDWILFSTSDLPLKAQTYCSFADMTIVTIGGESLWQLKSYMELKKPVAFFVAES